MDKIEITDEMVDAGMRAYSEWNHLFEEREGMVIRIIEAVIACIVRDQAGDKSQPATQEV